MAIATDPVSAASLSAAGQQNNPVVSHLNKGQYATVTTATGTEVSAALNVASGATYDFWRATPDAGFATIRFSFGWNAKVSFVGIAAHNLGSVGATLNVQYSVDGGSNWISSPAGTLSPTDNQALGFRFEEIAAADWRVVCSNVSADVIVGVIQLSEAITIPSRLYQGYTPPITPTNVDLQSNVSEGGHLLGSSVVRKSSMAQASIQHVPQWFIRGSEWKAFQKDFNGGVGIFWAWRPEKYPQDLFYAWRSGAALVPTNSGPLDYMSFDLSMRFYDEP